MDSVSYSRPEKIVSPRHKIKLEGGVLVCGCQGWRNNKQCSHTAAVRVWNFREAWNK